VRDLLDSLYRGYPSGAVLLWETDEAVPLQDFAVEQQATPYQSKRLLLDGQQRLTSLSAVIRGQPVNVRGRKKPIELLFNLEHPDKLAVVTEVEEDGDEDNDELEFDADAPDSTEDELQKRFDNMAFVVATKKLEQSPQWVKVTEVFKSDNDAPFLKRAGVVGFDDPRYEKYSQRLADLRGIRKYIYRMDVLERRLSYDEVTEIFVRVNSLGAKLRSSDLALAQITARWRGSLKVFQAFQSECAKGGFDLDLGLLLKNLIAFATGQSRFLTVGGLSLETLQNGWAQSVKGMEFALNFLRNNAGIDSPALLSSPFMLVSLGYFAQRRDYPNQRRRSSAPPLLGAARQREGPLFPRLQRDAARPGSRHHETGRRRAGTYRAPALSSRAARCRAGRTRRPQPAQRVVQDHVPRLPRRRGEGLAVASLHRARPLRRATPAAIPPHFPEGRAQASPLSARSRRYCKPCLHRRQDQPRHQRQAARRIPARVVAENRRGELRHAVHPARGRAGRRHVETRRAHPAGGERIEVRRLDLAPVAADVGKGHVIGDDEQDVRLVRRAEHGCQQRKRGEEEKQVL
jgi:hypothetical protein